MLIVSTLLYSSIALLLTLRAFKRVSLANAIIFFFLVTISINILVVEALSLLRQMDNPLLFLLIQLVLCLLSGLLLWDRGRKIFKTVLPSWGIQRSALRGWEWIPGIFIPAILLLVLVIGGLVPINNADSLHTHLLRIYYWIQHGSLASWNATTVTQLNYPINISIQGVWLFLLGGSERWFYLIQWVALAAAVCLVYKIARLLGAGRMAALLASLISLSFPVVLLQTFSYQGDVFIATLVLACVYFLLLHIKKGEPAWLYFSLLPLAIALGAKQTAFLFLPFYALVLLILYAKKSLTPRRALSTAGLLLALFVVFSSYKFIQNAVERDNLDSSMFANYRYTLPFSKPDSGRQYVTNAARYLYQGFSLDGLTGSWKLAARQAREDVFRSVFTALHTDPEVRAYISEGDEEYFTYSDSPPLNEDAAWFGPLGVLVLPLAVIFVFAGKDKPRKRYLLLALAYLLVVFLLMAVLISGWSPTNGRYLILPLMVMTPLFFVILPRQKTWARVVTTLVSLTALYLSLSTLLINDSRPLITQTSLYRFQQRMHESVTKTNIFKRAYLYLGDRVVEDLALTSPDRLSILQQTYYQNLFHQSTDSIADIEFVNANVSAGTPLYLLIRKDIVEYALFGVNCNRSLYPVRQLKDVPQGELVLVDNKLVPQPPEGAQLVAEHGLYSIYRK